MLFYNLIYGKKVKIGKHTTWRNNFNLMISNNGSVTIGYNCFFNNGCSINANNLVKIGNGTIIGENVKIYDHNHKFNIIKKPIKEQGYSNGSVHIGNHCWIGSNVVILKNSMIGNNCVIGAGCVVDFSVPDNTIVKCNNNFKFEVLIPNKN
jgi:acetyltransferase-like isoleucine patch superfamily enzyme